MIPCMGVTGPFEGLFCHEHQFESATRIFHFVLGRFDSGIEIVVREQAGDGDQKTECGRDQTLCDTARDGGRGSQLIPTHHAEGVHHAGHRAEQSEEGGGGDDGVEDGQATAEPFEFDGTRLADGLANGKVGVGKGKAEDSGHEIGGGVGDLDGSRLVATFHQSEDLFNLLRILAPFFRNNEERPFERNNRSHDCGKEQGPHDGSAVNEGTDDRIFVPVIS